MQLRIKRAVTYGTPNEDTLCVSKDVEAIVQLIPVVCSSGRVAANVEDETIARTGLGRSKLVP